MFCTYVAAVAGGAGRFGLPRLLPPVNAAARAPASGHRGPLSVCKLEKENSGCPSFWAPARDRRQSRVGGGSRLSREHLDRPVCSQRWADGTLRLWLGTPGSCGACDCAYGWAEPIQSGVLPRGCCPAWPARGGRCGRAWPLRLRSSLSLPALCRRPRRPPTVSRW